MVDASEDFDDLLVELERLLGDDARFDVSRDVHSVSSEVPWGIVAVQPVDGVGATVTIFGRDRDTWVTSIEDFIRVEAGERTIQGTNSSLQVVLAIVSHVILGGVQIEQPATWLRRAKVRIGERAAPTTRVERQLVEPWNCSAPTRKRLKELISSWPPPASDWFLFESEK